ncbi:L domain-like protein [Ascoidea rubescens DSM 1968]|uniref:L domain-like protein n=1 Tax=Ascoidea rubescens DSM 1968 TaxID=1344418 RepID=A0A1D2VDF8_9ASCO|nr:L domain-like protein [Ascoidea rubescens DSM 1968]ODV59734.1 L domain-like protein [Ascoidea rubescens DSM 1968]
MLNLSKNKINYINSKFFDNLVSLEILCLNGNRLKSLKFEKNSDNRYTFLPNLTRLELSGNFLHDLKFLNMNLDKCFTNLKKINLAKNNFNDISFLEALPLKHLEEINLQFNTIRRINLKKIKKLIKIDAYYNSIEVLPDLNDLIFLENLNLSNNKIKNISNGIINLKSLKKLNLSYNEIKKIENLPLIVNKDLELYLQGNKINSIDEFYFGKNIIKNENLKTIRIMISDIYLAGIKSKNSFRYIKDHIY